VVLKLLYLVVSRARITKQQETFLLNKILTEVVLTNAAEIDNPEKQAVVFGSVFTSRVAVMKLKSEAKGKKFKAEMPRIS
jgi:hypothetical protein